MFTGLLLALTIVTGTIAAPPRVPVNANRAIERPAPSAMAGPVRTRLRRAGGSSQMASTAVHQEIVRRIADEGVRPE